MHHTTVSRLATLIAIIATPILGFAQITWTGGQNVDIIGDYVEKNGGGSSWNSGAYSVETIASGDFYIEFIATETNKRRFIGFTDAPLGTVFNNMDGALLLHDNGNVHVYKNGSFRTNLGAFVANTTRMRIQVKGANIEYYLNDVLQFTETTATITYPVHVDLALNSNNGTFNNVDFGAGEPVRKADIVSLLAADPDGKDDFISTGDTITITFSEATDQAGLSGTLAQSVIDDLFTFTHSLGSGYTGSWTSPSIFTIVLATPPASLPRFAARVTPKTSPYQILPAAGGSATDEQSGPLKGNFGGEDVAWTDLTNASAVGNTISKTNGLQQFLSGAASARRFYEKDAWVEMTAVLTNHMRLIGFSKAQNPQASADLDYAVAFSDNGQVVSYAEGAFTTPSPTITYSPGDIVRVAIEGDDVRFYHNDVAFRTLSMGGVSPYPLRVGGVLGYSGADCAIRNARRSIPTPIIASFWADDPDNEDGWLSAGDTMELTFTAPTNQPPSTGVLPAAEVDSLFTFTHYLGDDYQGAWVSPSVFRVTLLAPTTLVPRFQATVTPTANPGYEILNAGDKGLPSTTTSLPLDGDWGSVIVEWTNLTNATAEGNDIIKDNLVQFQSGGVSTEQFEGGEPWIEGTADVLGNFRMFGFTTNDWPSEPHHLIWAIGFGESGDIVIYENGVDFPPTVPTTFKEGDVARIAVEDGYIVYYLESYEIHRTQLTAPLPFPMRYGAVLGYFQNIASIRNARHSVATPIIQDFRANDPNDGDDVYSAGDTYDILFDRPTDQAGTVNKAGVDEFFTFHNPSPSGDIPVSIGTDYAGEWLTKSSFRITVLAVDGTENVKRFVTIAQPNLQGTPPIYLEGKTIGRASIPSAPLEGDFGGQDLVWSTAAGILRGNPTIDGNTITKTTGAQWSQGSQSIQEFLSGDVWVEAWAPAATNNAVTFGLASNAPINQPYSPDYGMCFCENGEVRIYDDDSGTPAYIWTGTYEAGDTGRVEVINGVVKYFVGAAEFPYTSSITDADYPLYGEASLGYSDGASVIYTRLSYPIPSIYKVIADDPDDQDDTISAGDTVSMLFTIPTNQYGTPDQTGVLPKSEVDGLFNFSDAIGADYVGSWTTPSVFTVSIVDPTGTDLTRFHTIIDPYSTNIRNAGSFSRPSNTISPPIWGDFGGRRVDWQQLVNATAGGIHNNDIVRHNGLAAWDAGGTSEGDFEVLYGPVYVETVVRETNAAKALGLGKTNSHTDISDIEYAMYLDAQGRIFTSVAGTLSGSPVGTYSFEDIVRVAFEYEGAQAKVRWYNNDVLLAELDADISPLYPVTVDSALYAAGAVFYDVKTNWPCPVAFDDAYVTDENTPAVENVWDNDFHYGSGLSYVDTPPATGILTLSTRGAFVYDPAGQFESMQEGESTTVNFTYYLDNSRCTDGATVVITINGVNDCPVPGDDATSTTEDASVAGNVAGNDSDVEGDPLTFSAGTPGNGTMTVAANGDFSYDPNGAYDYLTLGQTATDRFTYIVSDGRCSVPGNVLVIIHGTNDCPIVTADSISMDEDNGGSGNVLANDSDPEGTPLSASLLSSPAGNLTFQADGSFSYDTNGLFESLAIGETATDSFTYRVSDGVCTADGNVVLVIHGANDCPNGVADSASTDQDSTTAGNVLGNDSDPDGDALTASNASGATGIVALSANGDFSYDPNGQFDHLDAGQAAQDSFSYTLSDGNCQVTVNAVVTVNGLNDCPVALADSARTSEHDPVAGNVASNDSDLDGDTLTASNAQGATGTVTLNPDGSFLYDPAGQFAHVDEGETAIDSFTYLISDGDCSDQATVTIIIDGANGCPVANADSASTDENTDVNGNVLTNDSDVDGDALSASGPNVQANGDFTYSPAGNFEHLDSGETATDSFTYIVSDGDCTDEGTVVITIHGVNDCPVANADSASTTEDASVAGNVLSNDSDVDGEPLTASNATGATGSVTLNADGSYVYDPNGQFDGLDTGETATDSFTYTVSDGNCQDSATVVIVIHGVNDCPVANDDVNATSEDATTAGNVLTNDTDVDGETLTASNATGSTGSVTLNPDGSYIYDPNGQFDHLDDGESAQDSFTYTISDGNCQDTATVVITINGGNDCPIANDDVNTTDENSTVAGNALANDTDVDVETLTASNATGATGSVTLNADGSYVYDPNGQFDGLDSGEQAVDSFTYTISDGTCQDTATVVITINGVNDCPVANDDANATTEDTTTAGNVLSNDTDVDGETLTASNATGATGSVTLNADGSYVYDPNGQFEDLDDGEQAIDSFTYTISDGTCQDTATVVITINGVNDCPVANDDVNATSEDATTAGNVLTNDTDVDGETLTASNATGSTGSVTLNPDGSYIYDPNGQFDHLDDGESAQDSFTYTISDGNCQDTATVVITINGGNDCPIANDDVNTTDENSTVAGNALANDTDVDVETLTASNATGATGSVTLNADGSYVYDPNGQFDGLDSGEQAVDSFTYTISDGTCQDTATVVITINGVNDCPVANDDANATTEDTTTAGNVLSNDTDVDGETLTASNATGATGSVTLNADGSYVYDPNGQFEDLDDGEQAIDSFTYTISDGTCQDTATVVITINGVNDCPVANDDVNATTEDTTTAGNVLSNDSDVDGEPLTASNATGATGSVTLNPDGSYVYDPNGQFEDLDTGEQAVDSFTYTISDGTCQDTATVVITINGVNDCPAANDDVNTTDENSTTSGNVLSNDKDVDVETLTASNATGATGNVTLNADGSYLYDPNGQFEDLDDGEVAQDSFTYTISDGNCQDTATVVITINGVNDCPVANDDANATDENSTVAGNVLSNDTDVDVETLTASNATGATGSVTLNADGSYVYDPNGQFDHLDTGEQAMDSFTYTISDGNCQDTATVVITINGVNGCPVAVADSAATDEDSTVAGNVLTNDSDDDGETLTASNATGAAGSVSLNPDGSFVYDPNGQFDHLDTGETATDSFTYTVSDGDCNETAIVVITINGVNDCPVANDDANATDENSTVAGNVLTNDTDVDGETLTASNATGATGSVTLNADGSYVYDPNGQFDHLDSGEVAQDSFTYTCSDGNCEVTATVVITINGVNDCPVANDDVNATSEDATTAGNVLTNDTDVDGETLTASNATGSTGSVTLNPDGSYIYDPNGQFDHLDTGEQAVDSFTYTISDGNCQDTATVVITINGVNDCPVANDDANATDENSTVAGNVLTNDTDVDGETLTASNATGAAGSVSLNPDGSFVYDPNGQFDHLDTGETATDSFTYTVSDGDCNETAIVVITINGVNDCPVANDDANATDENSTVAGNVLTNDTDVDGETLTASNATGATGSVTLNADGSYVYDPNGQFDHLDSGEVAQDSFTYTCSDGNCEVTATVVITINGVNDCPVANDDANAADENSTVAGNVLTNDTDVDGETLTASNATGATGSVTLNADGSYAYDPNGQFDHLDTGEVAQDSFSYTCSDGNCEVTATVVITISGVNDCPVANADSANTDEDSSVAGSVLSNDIDVDGETLTASNATGATGTVTLNADGSFVYDPAGNFDHLDTGETATDSFSYSISDGTCGDQATVVIVINGVNDCPVGVNDSNSTDEDTAVAGNVLTNDSDIDGDTLTASNASGATGTVSLNADGSYVYDPNSQFEALNAGESATDSFTYDLSDGSCTVSAQVVVVITGKNDCPVANDDTGETNEDQAIAGNVLDNDIAFGDDPLTAFNPTGAIGRVTLNADGSFVYDPAGNFEDLDDGEVAQDSFSYSISNGRCTDNATVVITINGRNDCPDAVADFATTNEQTIITGNVQDNDSDVDRETTTSTLLSSPLGSVTLQPDGSYVYDPTAHFEPLNSGESATDSFTYALSDGTCVDETTVTIVIHGVDGINRCPVAPNLTTETHEDTAITGSLGFPATDADGDPLTASNASGANGTVTLAPDGSFSYDPADAYQYLDNCEEATDSFTYVLSDGVCSSIGTVVIHIEGENDCPTANGDSNSTDEATATAGDVLANDYDVDDTRLVVTHPEGAQGEVTLNVDGSYVYDPNGKFDWLSEGQSATDSFTYILSNGHFHHNHGLGVGMGHAHDYADDGTLEGPGNGNHLGAGHVFHYHDHDDGCDPDDHTWAYEDHATHDHKEDHFDYSDEDGHHSHGGDTGAGHESHGLGHGYGHYKTRNHHHYGCFDVGHVVIVIHGTAGGAIANDQNFVVDEDALLQGQLSYSGLEGDLTFTVTDGAASINPDGSFVYNQNGAFDALCDGETANASFSYTVQDSRGANASATVSILINGSSDASSSAPVADAGGPYQIDEPGSVTLDGSGSSAGCSGIAAYAWDLDGNGVFDDAAGATPTASFNALGTHSIGLQVTSASGDTDSVTTTVTVGPRVGSPPVADIGGPYTAQPGETVVLDGSGSSDPDNDISAYQWDLDGDGRFDDATGQHPSIVENSDVSRIIGLRVVDAEGHTDIAQTVLTYKQDDVVEWTNLANVEATANTLTKTRSSAWNGNAWSVRALSEPGYVAVSATRGGKRMIGLSREDGGASIKTIEYALYLNISALEIYESGTHRGTIGAFNEGDELRITIDGRDIVYSRNGVELRRVMQAVPAGDYAYHADVSLETRGSSLTDIRLVTPAPEGPIVSSFRAFDPDNLNTYYSEGDTLTIGFHQQTDQAKLTGVQTKDEVDQLFDFTPAPGLDYAGSWADAATYIVTVLTPSATEPVIGAVTVRVAGGIPISNAKAPLPADEITTATLGGHYGSTTVLWIDPVNVLIEGAKVTRLFATNEAWDSGAYSSRQVSGNCYMETTVTERGKNKLIGFRHASSPADSHTPQDLAHAIFMHHSGSLEVYQSGVQKGRLGRYAVGDLLRMEIVGSSLHYYKNSVLLRTDSIDPVFTYRVGCSLQNPLATVDNTILVVDPAAPSIASFTVHDPGDRDRVFSVGDVFTIAFDGPTTTPRAEVTDLFAFSTPPGSDFYGLWTAPGRFEIEVIATGDEPVIGIDTVAPAGIVPIYYADSQLPVNTTPATLSGSYGDAPIPVPDWDDPSWRATITNGAITASFQAGKPYAINGLLSASPLGLSAPVGESLVSQTANASSVSTTYTWPDGSSETIIWDFDGGDLRCTTSARTELPGLDLAGHTLVTLDADGCGVISGDRVDHLPIALLEGANTGWVISGNSGDFDVAGALSSDASELRIRSYSGDWGPAVDPHRATLGLTPFSSPVRAYSSAPRAELIPSRTLLGPLSDLAEIANASAAGYVVIADLASVSEAAAIAAGASVLYAANPADLPANPGADTASSTLTSGAQFALFDNPGHALGGYLFDPYIVIAPAGSMVAPTDVDALDAFMGFGHYLPAYGADSWNAIVAVVQAQEIADPVWEVTNDSFSLLVGGDRIGTRVTGLTSYSGPGAIADWRFYNGDMHIGLDADATYYFDPTLSLDPDAFHVRAVPADFALLSQSGDGYDRLEISGNGIINLVIPANHSVFIDGVPAASGNHSIAGAVTIHALPESVDVIHGLVTSASIVGTLPVAASISLQGSVSGIGTVHVNGQLIYSGSGPFDIDLSAYSGSNVVIEFGGGVWSDRNIIFSGAPPVADIGGPYAGNEGSTIALSAANSFNAVSYAWDLDNDGNYDDANGASVSFDAAADGVYPIALRIDNNGLFDTASTTVTVANLPPVADIGGPYHAAPGETITLDASASSDAGNDALSFAWDFDGDGNFDDATGANPSYTPIAIGNLSIAVQVSDDMGEIDTGGIGIGVSNNVVFTAIKNLVVDGNNLERVTGNGWSASAISVGSLIEDGYLEFTATIAGKAMVGLSQGDTSSHFKGIEFAFYKSLNKLEIYESGVQRGSYGSLAEGDLLRITIDKGDVVYTHNGDELRRLVAVLPREGFDYNADVSIEARGTTVTNVKLAVPTPEPPRIISYEGFDADNLDIVYGAGDTVTITMHQKTDMAGFQQDEMLTRGQVDDLFDFNPAPGADYRGYWSHPAIFVVEILDPATAAPAFGSASVSVAGDIVINNAKVPLPADDSVSGVLSGHWGSVVVLWTNAVNVIVEGNKLIKPSSGSGGWNGGAVSSRSFVGDGYLETVVTETGKNRMIGFSSEDSNQHFQSLDYAIFLHRSNTAEAYEDGRQRGSLGGFRSGDTLRIARIGNRMHYLVNGLTRRITDVDAGLALQVDCSLSAKGGTLNNTILVLPDSVINASRATSSEAIRDAISITLDAGWNLIGIPLTPDDPTPDFLDGATAEAGHAYWVFAATPSTVILTGRQVAQPPIPASGLYAPVRNSPVPAGYSAFSYSTGAWRQLPADAALQPGTGYQLQ